MQMQCQPSLCAVSGHGRLQDGVFCRARQRQGALPNVASCVALTLNLVLVGSCVENNWNVTV